MEPFTYEAQLTWLNRQLVLQRPGMNEKDRAASLRMFLSLSQSVKTARDHQLNCSASARREAAKELYDVVQQITCVGVNGDRRNSYVDTADLNAFGLQAALDKVAEQFSLSNPQVQQSPSKE